MEIFFVTATGEPTILQHWHDLARLDRFGVHRLTADAEKADAIVFLDPNLLAHRQDFQLRGIREHPLARRYPDKIFVYDERDLPWRAFPGVYVSMPARYFDRASQRAYCYSKPLNQRVFAGQTRQPDLLFSFVGSQTHPVREALLQLEHPRALVEKNLVNMFDQNSEAIEARKEFFAEILGRSKFVLCPRGFGTASIRLFECLSAGRVPVIISDAWVAPDGPDWAACSLRVRESEVARIPQLLKETEADWPAMSEAACQTHRDWFAPDALFHRYAECYAALLPTAARGPKRWNRPFFDSALNATIARVRNRRGPWK